MAVSLHYMRPIYRCLAMLQGLHSVSELGNVSLVAAGAGAGAAYWGSVYPADIIKSRLQVDSFTNPRYKGIMDCARQVSHAKQRPV
jgi:solute carrier family 25 (mitochondrial carnitine/acylcarnitine transporter), member 20/29